MDNWDTWIIYRLEDVSCYVIVRLSPVASTQLIPDYVPIRYPGHGTESSEITVS